MFGRWLATGVFFALASGGCGGAVEHSEADSVGSPGGSAGSGPRLGRAGQGNGGAATGGRVGGAGASAVAGAGGVRLGDDEPVPVDVGCTPEALPAPTLECDAFSGEAECGAGMGCYPFVEHPGGDGCGAQVYGTLCQPAGTGTQDALCGDDTGDRCAPGHVCVIGQRPGKRCAALCAVGVPNQCQNGLLCGNLDVAGFGVCG